LRLAEEELGSRLLRPSRPAACWAEEAERLRGAGWAERPKTSEGEKEIFYFFFFFSNISNAFSNSFLKSFSSSNKNQSTQIKICNGMNAQACI
jgi:hypothetical protein